MNTQVLAQMSDAELVNRYVRIKGMIAALETELNNVKEVVLSRSGNEFYGDNIMLKIKREAERVTYSKKNLLTILSEDQLATVATKTVYPHITMSAMTSLKKAA
jgi:hypothetical protein